MTLRRLSVVAGLALLIVSVPWAVYRHTSTHTDFQFYEPTQLPAGVAIKQKRVDQFGTPGHIRGTTVELNFRTVDWVYSVDERPIDPEGYGLVTTLHNYDPTSTKPTCEQRHTAGGMSYRLCHWIDYGRINVYQTNFAKGSTSITSRMPNETDQAIPVESLDTFVDSFKPASTVNFPVIWGSGA